MAEKSPAISVVIPAYNEEKFLGDCLKSLQEQTFKDFEIIVVDNNSTDNTASLAKSFGARVISEKKQGMIPAREKGFREARADIIARTDADTKVSPDWLETIYNAFRNDPGLVGITGTFISGRNRVIDIPSEIWSSVIVQFFGRVLTGHPYLIGSNMAVRKSALSKIKIHGDDKIVHEDFDLSCHLYDIGKLKHVRDLTATVSLRKFKTVRGLSNYLTRYPAKYVRTFRLHKHHYKNRLKISRSESRRIFKNAISELKSTEARLSHRFPGLSLKKFHSRGLKKTPEADN